MNIRVLVSIFTVLLILFAGNTIHADNKIVDQIKSESNADSKYDETNSLYSEIRESSEGFNATSKWEQLKDLSVKVLLLWVIIAGILFFIGARRIAAAMLGFGFIGFVFINYPKEITALFMEGAEYVSSLLS